MKSSYFRSALMLSAHNLKHLKKIPELSAECIILNLEDGVASELKPLALKQCAETLLELTSCKKELVVRINALDEGGREEIAYLNGYKPDAIRIPKIRSIKDVDTALKLVDKSIDLHLSIETKEAWQNLSQLAIDKRVKAFYLGILDLFADLGLSQELITPTNETLHYILSHFLITCKSIGVEPVSFVFQEYKNMERFDQWLELEKRLGYRSKGCISPAQVERVNAAFSPESKDIAKAKKIILLFEAHQKEGVTGFVDEELGFIDEPIYKGACSLVSSL